MKTIEVGVDMLGRAYTITFRNWSQSGNYHTWVFTNPTECQDEADKLRMKSHIEVVQSGPATVK